MTQDEAFLNKMQLSIVPFFHTTTAKGEVFGPFLSLPHEIQTKALDILFYLPSWSEKLVKSIVTTMNSKNLACSKARSLRTLECRFGSIIIDAFSLFGYLRFEAK